MNQSLNFNFNFRTKDKTIKTKDTLIMTKTEEKSVTDGLLKLNTRKISEVEQNISAKVRNNILEDRIIELEPNFNISQVNYLWNWTEELFKYSFRFWTSQW